MTQAILNSGLVKSKTRFVVWARVRKEKFGMKMLQSSAAASDELRKCTVEGKRKISVEAERKFDCNVEGELAELALKA